MPNPEPIVFEREYAASPERVFAAWKIHEWDVRPGGKIRVSLAFDQGP